MHVYAVLYSESGDFLIARKLERGHFFGNPSSGWGTIIAKGQSLQGANNHTLPGGRLFGREDIERGALREFLEGTGLRLENADSAIREWPEFAAAYFEISKQELQKVVEATRRGLKAARQASAQIASETLRKYSEIHLKFPEAPWDDELVVVNIWNVWDDDTWSLIHSWKDDRELGWYFLALQHLRKMLFVTDLVDVPAC